MSKLVSFPDPERARAKKGSGDNATVSSTLEGRGHVTLEVIASDCVRILHSEKK